MTRIMILVLAAVPAIGIDDAFAAGTYGGRNRRRKGGRQRVAKHVKCCARMRKVNRIGEATTKGRSLSERHASAFGGRNSAGYTGPDYQAILEFVRRAEAKKNSTAGDFFFVKR